MVTAQIEVWVGVHRGSIDNDSSTVGHSVADTALGRMMLHGRRAAVAEAVDEFISVVGSRFMPHGRAQGAPIDFKTEMAAAVAAGEIVIRECGLVPALLFERATLAEMDGRRDDALADLQQLLDCYPGFLQAAIADARLALASGNPGRAIRSLAVVEVEITHTREGAMLLADALRAIGMHQAAARYDLAALLNTGRYDTRGNDCAPVDVTGNAATDNRMPPLAISAGKHQSGAALCNDRGVYYLMISGLSKSLSAFIPAGHSFYTGVSTAKLGSGRPKPKIRTAAKTLARSAVALLPIMVLVMWRQRRWIPQKIRIPMRTASVRLASALKVQKWVLPLLREFIKNQFALVQIPDHTRLSPTVQLRFQSGIARIFGMGSKSNDPQTVAHSKLPAAGDEIFKRLMHECSIYKQSSDSIKTDQSAS